MADYPLGGQAKITEWKAYCENDEVVVSRRRENDETTWDISSNGKSLLDDEGVMFLNRNLNVGRSFYDVESIRCDDDPTNMNAIEVIFSAARSFSEIGYQRSYNYGRYRIYVRNNGVFYHHMHHVTHENIIEDFQNYAEDNDLTNIPGYDN